MSREIPVSEPSISNLEKQYVLQALDSGWISSSGFFVDSFQELWAQECGTKYCLAVSNGTVALHLILLGLEIGAGDEVIVPSLTFIATANAVRYVGAVPIFCDVNIKTWCLDRNLVEEVFSSHTKAVIFVALYGNTSGVENLKHLCEERNIYLIEDAAEAPFASSSGQPTGSFGIASSFSFYGNKILTSGEGGAVVTSNSDLYQKMKLLRDQGMDPNNRYYFIEVGYNYRLTNLQCAVLCAQLERKIELLEKRKDIFQKYDEGLNKFGNFFRPRIYPEVVESPWLYTIALKDPKFGTPKSLALLLKEKGVDSRPIFIPIHTLPPYKGASSNHLPNTMHLSERGITLPTYPSLSENELEVIIKIVGSFLAGKRE